MAIRSEHESRRKVVFGAYRFDPRSGDLHKNGRLISLPKQAALVLRTLVENPSETVSRDELRELLWPNGTFVDFEHGLNRIINKLRSLLGDNAEKPRFIQTVPGVGYRFLASVEVHSDSQSETRSALVSELPTVGAEVATATPKDDSSSQALTRKVIEEGSAQAYSSYWRSQPRKWIALIPIFIAMFSVGLYLIRDRAWIHRGVSVRTTPASAIASDSSQALCRLGWFFRNKGNGEATVRAVATFRQAVAADPHNAEAWSGLADSIFASAQYEHSVDRTALTQEGSEAERQAMALGPLLPLAHLSAGSMYYFEANLVAAEREYRQAIELDSNFGEAHYRYALAIQEERGLIPEVSKEFELAMKLESSSARVFANAGAYYAQLHNYRKAEELLRHALELDSDSGLAYGNLGLLFLQEHQYGEALSVFRKAKQLAGTILPYGAAEVFCLGRMGRKRDAQELSSQIVRFHAAHPFFPAAMAIMYCGLGDDKDASVWAAKAFRSGTISRRELAQSPYFERLRDSSTFRQLVGFDAARDQ